VVKFFFENVVKKQFPDLDQRYVFSVWDDEEVQRRRGFDLCSNDMILNADGDTLIKLHVKTIRQFHNDRRRGVAGVRIWNMVSSNIYFSPTNSTNRIMMPMFAKKSVVDARTFFDHLWIVGVRQRSPDYSIVFPHSLGEAHHYTIARSPITMIIKYAFYLTLESNFKQFIRNNPIEVLTSMKRNIGVDVARNIFLRHLMVSGTCLSSGNFLLATPSKTSDLFPNLVRGDPFPGFSLPHGSRILCNYTFLNGYSYDVVGKVNKQHRIPLVDGFKSFISLNKLQSSRRQLCIKVQHVKFCEAQTYVFQLGSRHRRFGGAVTTRKLSASEDAFVMVIPLLPSAGEVDRSTFVRFVLSMNCQVSKHPMNGNESTSNYIGVGWYYEVPCKFHAYLKMPSNFVAPKQFRGV
jgi:hypothetical protein